ncbi:MAG: hypothetical protein ABSF80_00830 [Chitinispirillaceae bacterium]|jgi:hypothetical protein
MKPKAKQPVKFLKVLVAVLSCTSFLFAQAEGSTAAEQAQTKAHEKAEQKASAMKIHGKVVSVDIIANTIIVKTQKAEDTLNVDAGTKIMLGMMELSKKITFRDLQTDDMVTITFQITNGRKTATIIVKKSDVDFKWGKETH